MSSSSSSSSSEDAISLEADDNELLSPPSIRAFNLPPPSGERHPSEWLYEDRLIQSHKMAVLFNTINLFALAIVIGFNLAGNTIDVPLIMQYHRISPLYDARPESEVGSIGVASLAFVYVGFHLLENMSCGVWFVSQFKRMIDMKSNPLREGCTLISIICIHLQLALLTGIVDILTLFYMVVVMIACFLLKWTADLVGTGVKRSQYLSFATLLWFAAWIPLLVHWIHALQDHQELFSALAVLGILIILLELIYVSVMHGVCKGHSTSESERYLLLAGLVHRTIVAWCVVIGMND